MKMLSSKLKRRVRIFMGKHCPKLLVTILYRQAFGKWINWKNPQDLNEKIHWLKFYTDTTLWTLLADKYRVRKYVKEKGCPEILVKLYGAWDKPTLIDWENLPNEFVMKSNGGCGDVLICKDKSMIDKNQWIKHFEKVIKMKCGYERGEPHYNTIKPVIIAEELLDSNKQSVSSSSLIDYKIWCFNGEPYSILVCSNRTHNTLELSDYDLDWNYHPEHSKYGRHYVKASQVLPRPLSLNKMLDYARKLSKGLPQVRVDFYEIDGKPYFGEMTMTSAGGFMDYYTDEYLKEMGKLIKL